MIHPITTLPLSSKHRVSQITFHPTRSYLAVQSHDRSVEIFRIRTEEEVRKKQARRKKCAKEKKEQSKTKGKEVVAEDHEDADTEITIPDLFTPYLVVRASGKVRSFDFADEESASAVAKGSVSILLALSNNALEVYSVPAPGKGKAGKGGKEGEEREREEAVRTISLDLPGHRADVRTLCLSSDDMLLASAANGTSSFPISTPTSLTKRERRYCRIPKDMEHEDPRMHPHHGMRLRHLQHLPPRRPPSRHWHEDGGDTRV